MKHLHVVRRVVDHMEIMYSVLPPDKLKEVIEGDLVRSLARAVGKHVTVREIPDTLKDVTVLEASVAIIPEGEYLRLMKELHDLREIVDKARRLFGGKEQSDNR